MNNLFKLRVVQDTFLKLENKPVTDLASDEKYALEAGSEFPVNNFHQSDSVHFRLAFGIDDHNKQIAFPGPGGQGRNTWFVFANHCALLNADGTPAPQFFSKISLKLQDFLKQDLKFSLEAIATNKILATQIQSRLIYLGLLSSSADGNFGPISAEALQTFQELMKLSEQGFLGKETAKKLIETKAEMVPKAPLKLGSDLASRIIKYMQAKGYNIATRPYEYNIVYLEGADADGKPNRDRPNYFNDRRLLITFANGVPNIVGNWEATTEPGSYYTYTPMNARGAARIKFGQYKAWQVDIHGTAEPHEALVQVGEVSVYRDYNQDFMRTNDQVDTGGFGINQHWGYDYPGNDIVTASAGCLVGRTRKGHQEFMAIVKKDQRYRLNRHYLFETTIIAGDALNERFP
ncbi:MAG: peptidoglycan-binding domain-containing protein [Leptolyngbyaceae cyanobacterium]